MSNLIWFEWTGNVYRYKGGGVPSRVPGSSCCPAVTSIQERNEYEPSTQLNYQISNQLCIHSKFLSLPFCPFWTRQETPDIGQWTRDKTGQGGQIKLITNGNKPIKNAAVTVHTKRGTGRFNWGNVFSSFAI